MSEEIHIATHDSTAVSEACVTSDAGASAAPRRVLVVGAGGFVGGYLVEEALRRGYEVWAGVRSTTSRARLSDSRIRIIEFDFDDPSSLSGVMSEALPEGKWDYIIYNLGATKVTRYADFNRINHDYLRAFTGALHQSGKIPEKLVFISSLSVLGPRDERGGTPYDESEIPLPDTRYGASKLKAELWLATSGIPYVILRATGVYGPWDRDYFLMIESIRKGFDFGVGFRKQTLTFIYAADLARAALDAAERASEGEIYNISEPRSYSQKEFRKIVMSALGRHLVVPLRLPLWTVGVVCAVAEKIGSLRMKPSTLNRDKFRILRRRNWNCSTDKALRDFGFKAETPLKDGIERSIIWYREAGWLK
ncbi:MAG: NAD(P)-dependent oxidoreductase [Muribaculaceae bacterium]|nr:NAD(P)-dependent oxidoreductase [Muribaculaceae bacterium]